MDLSRTVTKELCAERRQNVILVSVDSFKTAICGRCVKRKQKAILVSVVLSKTQICEHSAEQCLGGSRVWRLLISEVVAGAPQG